MRQNLDYDILFSTLRTLALKGGDEIMSIYSQDDFGVESKDDDSPVTKADRAADAVIYEGLKTAFPDVTIITEEQAASHG